MEIKSIVQPVTDHLKNKGITAEFVVGRPVNEARLKKAEMQLGISIPDGLRRIYKTAGDGICYLWENSKNDGQAGGISVVTLKELIALNKTGREHHLWRDDYEFPFVDDSKLAKKTFKLMKSWIPFLEEGNGDGFCIDTGSLSGAVVFHQHDWFDGGTGKNGQVVASSLESFIRDWAKVCFQCPSSLWWPSVFKSGKVNWKSDEFDKGLILKL